MDKNVIVLDGEKNVIGLVTVAAKSAPKVVGWATETGKPGKKFKYSLKTFDITVCLRLTET